MRSYLDKSIALYCLDKASMSKEEACYHVHQSVPCQVPAPPRPAPAPRR